jgi:hypothetical protein
LRWTIIDPVFWRGFVASESKSCAFLKRRIEANPIGAAAFFVAVLLFGCTFLDLFPYSTPVQALLNVSRIDFAAKPGQPVNLLEAVTLRAFRAEGHLDAVELIARAIELPVGAMRPVEGKTLVFRACQPKADVKIEVLSSEATRALGPQSRLSLDFLRVKDSDELVVKAGERGAPALVIESKRGAPVIRLLAQGAVALRVEGYCASLAGVDLAEWPSEIYRGRMLIDDAIIIRTRPSVTMRLTLDQEEISSRWPTSGIPVDTVSFDQRPEDGGAQLVSTIASGEISFPNMPSKSSIRLQRNDVLAFEKSQQLSIQSLNLVATPDSGLPASAAVALASHRRLLSLQLNGDPKVIKVRRAGGLREADRGATLYDALVSSDFVVRYGPVVGTLIGLFFAWLQIRKE